MVVASAKTQTNPRFLCKSLYVSKQRVNNNYEKASEVNSYKLAQIVMTRGGDTTGCLGLSFSTGCGRCLI